MEKDWMDVKASKLQRKINSLEAEYQAVFRGAARQSGDVRRERLEILAEIARRISALMRERDVLLGRKKI